MDRQTSSSPCNSASLPVPVALGFDFVIFTHAQCFRTASGFKERYVDIRSANKCRFREVRRFTRCSEDM